MSEETKSAGVRNTRRFLYIANPGSDSDGSSGEDNQRSQVESGTSQSHTYSYQPTALPSPSRDPRPLPKVTPSPLTTNLPQENGPPNGYFNPNLSSPSSTSSNANAPTPPPSTPGLGGPAVELPQEPRHEPMIMPHYEPHYNGVSHVSSRPAGFLDKIKAAMPHRHSHSSRTSNASHQSNSVRIPFTVGAYLDLSFVDHHSLRLRQPPNHTHRPIHPKAPVQLL